jgi:hypothetical protein
MAVMIGVDPHKGSHTAVAIGPAEEPLGRQQVRACPDQAGQLLAWAAAWPQRTWAAEGATGLGRLLAQQLAAAGERVLDIQPKLAARVRAPDDLGVTCAGEGGHGAPSCCFHEPPEAEQLPSLHREAERVPA